MPERMCPHRARKFRPYSWKISMCPPGRQMTSIPPGRERSTEACRITVCRVDRRIRVQVGGTLRGVDESRLEEVLADEFLADVASISMDELRGKRAACQTLEVELSYQ